MSLAVSELWDPKAFLRQLCLSQPFPDPTSAIHRLPHPDEVRTSPSGPITGCTSPAAQGYIYDPFGPCLLPLIRREVSAMLLWPQCCPPVLTSPTCCAARQAHHPEHPSLWTRTERTKCHKTKKKKKVFLKKSLVKKAHFSLPHFCPQKQDCCSIPSSTYQQHYCQYFGKQSCQTKTSYG